MKLFKFLLRDHSLGRTMSMATAIYGVKSVSRIISNCGNRVGKDYKSLNKLPGHVN